MRAVCRLRGGALVDHLPRSCPLRDPHPGRAVNEISNLAFAAMDLANAHHDPAAGLQALHRAEICGRCVGELSGHPVVQLLRRTAR